MDQGTAKPPNGFTSEFMTCGCETCAIHPGGKDGKTRSWPTALAGFIAGAAVAAVILVPWMLFLGALCSRSSWQTPVEYPEAPPFDEEITPEGSAAPSAAE